MYVSKNNKRWHNTLRSNALLLGMIPLNYEKYNNSSSVAIFLDSSSYIVVGASTSITGFVVDNAGWSELLTLWIIAIIVAIVSIRISILNKQSDLQTTQKIIYRNSALSQILYIPF